MSAQVLRQAAALMRKRAQAAEQGRWKLWGMTVMADPLGTSNVDDAIDVASTYSPSDWRPQLRTFNATHIASWHPAVALAVADWLDEVATSAERVRADIPDMFWGDQALAVARAYLGEQP